MILLFAQFVYCGIMLRLNLYKRPLPNDVTFVNILRHMCWTISVRYNMYVSIHVYYCYVNFDHAK